MMYFRGEDRFPHGSEVDLTNALSKKTGCQFVPSELNRALSLKLLEAGQLDISATVAWTPARAKDHWVLVTAAVRNQAVLSKAALPNVKTPNDLLTAEGIKVGMVRDGVNGPPYDELIEQLKLADKIIVVPDQPSLFQQLKLGHIQAAFAYPFVYAQYLSKQALADDFRVLDWSGNQPSVRGGWAFSRKRFTEQQIQHWQKLFVQIRTDGTLERIFAHYFDPETARALIVQP